MYAPDTNTNEDDRGRFIEVWKGSDFKEINYMEIKKGVSRGGHYHKENKELMVVAKGKLTLTIEHMQSGEKAEKEVSEGDCFVIEPYDKHTLTALEDSALVSCNTVEPYNQDSPDVFTE